MIWQWQVKQTDLFDYYYDLYGKNFIEFKQSEGRVNPKIMGGSDSTKSEARKMTIYFDQRAEQQKAEESSSLR